MVYFHTSSIPFHDTLDQKNNSDQTYGSPGDQGVSALRWPNLRASVKPPGHQNTIALRGVRGALNWDPIMPIDASLSDCECKFFLVRRRYLNVELKLRGLFYLFSICKKKKYLLICIVIILFYSLQCVSLKQKLVISFENFDDSSFQFLSLLNLNALFHGYYC